MRKFAILLVVVFSLPVGVRADQGAPVTVATGTLPVSGGACVEGLFGRVQVEESTGTIWCCVGGFWDDCGTGYVEDHEAQADPHPVYLTATEGDGRYLSLTGGSLSGTLTVPSATVSSAAAANEVLRVHGGAGADSWIYQGYTNFGWYWRYHGSTSGDGGNEISVMSDHTGAGWIVDHDGNLEHIAPGVDSAGGARSIIWHAGNDGAASGLDADTLDGLHATSFLQSESDPTVAGAISAHEGASDPHPQYLSSYTETDPSIPASCAAAGQPIEWNGTAYACGTDDTGGGASVPTTTSILKGDGQGGITTMSTVGCGAGYAIRYLYSTGTVSCTAVGGGSSFNDVATVMGESYWGPSIFGPIQPGNPYCVQWNGFSGYDPLDFIQQVSATSIVVDGAKWFKADYEAQVLVEFQGGPLPDGEGAHVVARLQIGGATVFESHESVTGMNGSVDAAVTLGGTWISQEVGNEVELCVDVLGQSSQDVEVILAPAPLLSILAFDHQT